MLRFGSLCSGIEAASVAWAPLGWRAAWLSEVDPFCCALLEQRWPGVPNRGDMTRYERWPDGAVDVVCGGTPCQSFSVAGQRGGMADHRGNLALVFLDVVARYRPGWVVWENVPGVLSSNGGRDFGAFLGRLGQLGYGFAYRVLDAQYFGLAQRRARVFVVGRLGDWRGAAAVLFERESLLGHPAPRRQAGQDVAGAIDAGFGVRRGSGMNPNQLAAFGGNNTAGALDVVAGLNAKGGSGRMDFDSETFITHAFDARQSDVIQYGDMSGPLDTDGHSVGVTINVLPFDTTQMTSAGNRSRPKVGDPCHPLAAGMHAPSIAFTCKDSGQDVGDDMAPTLRAMEHGSGNANAGGQVAVSSGSMVRRLTPKECERLQGFPDDYTLVRYRGAQAKDGPRYRAIGNSWAVPVVQWIGRRIELVESLCAMRSAA